MVCQVGFSKNKHFLHSENYIFRSSSHFLQLINVVSVYVITVRTITNLLHSFHQNSSFAISSSKQNASLSLHQRMLMHLFSWKKTTYSSGLLCGD